MTKIHYLDEHRPHLAGNAGCHSCGNEWVAVVPVNADLRTLECPECGSQNSEFEINE